MLKINTISVILMLLAGSMVVPTGLSYAQVSNSTMSDQTGMNDTLTTSENNTMTVQNATTSTPAMTNQTQTNETMTSENSTGSQTNDTTDAVKVSDFIHQAVADFKQQGDETRKVIFDCRDRIQTAAAGDVDSIKNDCSIQLNAIKAKYQEERIQYQDYVKQYRQSVMVFLSDARGLSVGKAAFDNAISQLGMMMHNGMSNGKVMGKAATVNNTNCVNPPGGPAYC